MTHEREKRPEGLCSCYEFGRSVGHTRSPGTTMFRYISSTQPGEHTSNVAFKKYVGFATQTIGMSGKPIYQPSESTGRCAGWSGWPDTGGMSLPSRGSHGRSLGISLAVSAVSGIVPG